MLPNQEELTQMYRTRSNLKQKIKQIWLEWVVSDPLERCPGGSGLERVKDHVGTEFQSLDSQSYRLFCIGSDLHLSMERFFSLDLRNPITYFEPNPGSCIKLLFRPKSLKMPRNSEEPFTHVNYCLHLISCWPFY